MCNRWMCWFVVLALAMPSVAPCKDVEEKYDDGAVHFRYRTDAKDRKNGDFQELYPGGKVHVRGTYTADKKTGTWTTYSKAGKPLEISHYSSDQLDGSYQWNFPTGLPAMRGTYRNGFLDGAVNTFDEKSNPVFSVSYPIPWEQVLNAWNKWYPPDRADTKVLEDPLADAPYKAGKIAPECQETALKYVMLYRFLSGVPANNMSIDPVYVDKCQHGAVIIRHLGHLTHTPEKPADMPDSFFKIAYAGTSSSNLSQGRRNLFDSIDDYMDDSDESNIQKVGHRQWVLDPPMLKTAFGYDDGFSSMYSFDSSRPAAMNWIYIAYPGPGYYPHQLLRDHAAWSLSLNPQKCKPPSARSIEINVFALDDHFALVDTSTATIVNMQMCPNGGAWPCFIFKPQIKKPGVGKYVVQVKGVRTLTGAPAPLSYLVDVTKMLPPDGEK